MHGSATIIILALLGGGGDASVTVHTRTGDTLVGTEAVWTDTGLLLHHPTLGMLEIPAEEIVDGPVRVPQLAIQPSAVTPPPLDPPVTPPGRALHVQSIVDAVLTDAAARTEASEWTGGMGAAMTASRTSQETWNVRLSGRLDHVDDSGQARVNGSWYLNIADGNVTDNDLLIRGERDWLLPNSPWQWFLQSTWQYDQFETWAHRVSPYTGVGFTVIDDEAMALTFKGGGGATYEYGMSDTRPQALFEANGRIFVSSLTSLQGNASIAPSVRSVDDYLATLNLILEMRLNRASPIAINIGVRSIYDSTPGPEATHNDLKLWTGLDWTF